MRRNPFAPEVPCHRVVHADGSLGGFFGKTTPAALQKKRDLLEAEGVRFDSANRVESRFITSKARAHDNSREPPGASAK